MLVSLCSPRCATPTRRIHIDIHTQLTWSPTNQPFVSIFPTSTKSNACKNIRNSVWRAVSQTKCCTHFRIMQYVSFVERAQLCSVSYMNAPPCRSHSSSTNSTHKTLTGTFRRCVKLRCNVKRLLCYTCNTLERFEERTCAWKWCNIEICGGLCGVFVCVCE